MGQERRGGPARSIPNLFLASLPHPDYERPRPHLEPVDFPSRLCLYSAGQPIEYCYFPSRGIISNVVMLEDGSEVEAGITGRDGVVGLSALMLPGAPAPHGNLVQLDGEGFRVRAGRLREPILRRPDILDLVFRFSLIHAVQIAQTAACNARHSLPQRLARWLLMAHDLADGEVLPMTHQILSTMLGVRRPGVTIAVRALQESGAIHSARARITILDRARVEQACCECYRAVRDRTETILDGI